MVDFFALDIVEAFSGPGCALCRVLAETAERDMATFVREGRMVPAARDRFVAGGGFCTPHAWLFHRVAVRAGAAYAVADVYGRLIERDVERLARPGRRPAESLERPAACPACVGAEDALARKADFFVGALADGSARAAYERSEGLCGPHVAAAVAVAGQTAPRVARYLLSDRRRRLERLGRDLAEYDRKRDHRYADEPKGVEQAAIAGIVRLYAGDPGDARV